MFARGVLTALLIAFAITGCGLTGYERWAAYQVEVQVLTADQQPLAGAVIASSEDQEVKTDEDGLAELRYMVGGVKVITVTAPGWQTVQTKLPVPSAEPMPLRIILTEPSAFIPPKQKMAANQG